MYFLKNFFEHDLLKIIFEIKCIPNKIEINHLKIFVQCFDNKKLVPLVTMIPIS